MGELKRKKSLKIGSYFRELSIVIIGVAVTLYASGIISSIQERKDVKLQLNTIAIELEDNLNRVSDLIDYYDRIDSLRVILKQHYTDPESVDADDMRGLTNVIGLLPGFTYKRGAFDMLVNSGAMKLVRNKTLLSEISECYALLETTKEAYEQHISLKIEHLHRMMDRITPMTTLDITEPYYISVINFILNSSGESFTPKETKTLIEKVLDTYFNLDQIPES